MAYQKKKYYPSYKKPGVYPNNSDEELGLNNDELDEDSLGTWNSLMRYNKILPTSPVSDANIDERGRPVQLLFNEFVFPYVGAQTFSHEEPELEYSSFFISFLIKKNSSDKITHIRWTNYQSEHIKQWPIAPDTKENQGLIDNQVYFSDDFSYQALGDSVPDAIKTQEWAQRFTYLPYINPRFNGSIDAAKTEFNTNLRYIPLHSALPDNSGGYNNYFEVRDWQGIPYYYSNIVTGNSFYDNLEDGSGHNVRRDIPGRVGLIPGGDENDFVPHFFEDGAPSPYQTNPYRDQYGRYGIIILPSGNEDEQKILRDQYIEILRFYCLTPDDPELRSYWNELSPSPTIPGDGLGAGQPLYGAQSSADLNAEGWGNERISQIVKRDGDKYGFEFYGLKSDKKINFEDGFGYIKERPRAEFESLEDEIPVYNELTRAVFNQLYGFEIELDDELAQKFKNLVYERPLKNHEEGYSRFTREASWESNTGYYDASNLSQNQEGGYWTHEVIIPRQFRMKTETTDNYIFNESLITSYPIMDLWKASNETSDLYINHHYYPVKIPYDADYTNVNFGSGVKLGLEGRKENDSNFLSGLWNPLPFGTDNILSMNYQSIYDLNDQSDLSNANFIHLGRNFYDINEGLLFGEFNYDNILRQNTSNDLNESLNFNVKCIAESNTDLLSGELSGTLDLKLAPDDSTSYYDIIAIYTFDTNTISNENLLRQIIDTQQILSLVIEINGQDGNPKHAMVRQYFQRTEEDGTEIIELYLENQEESFDEWGLSPDSFVTRDFFVDILPSGLEPLYYDVNNRTQQFFDTSYPLKVNLNIELYSKTKNMGDSYSGLNPGFVNTFDPNIYSITIQDLLYVQENPLETIPFFVDQVLGRPGNMVTATDHHYRYKVIQWGDEETLLTDEQIKNSFYFSIYDKENYPNAEDFSYKKFSFAQQDFIPIEDFSTHYYNTPGVKSIKIVIRRMTIGAELILQSYLVTKNIVINDGNTLSQDFSIFGGTDFNFLPIGDNQAIIGGLDEDSNYNNSVSKIVKDDNFVQEDYLERVSSKDYIRKFNSGLLGKTPGQLDLSQTRVFTESRDIYDFIGGDKLEWINNGSGSLPLNSLATDIFIRDEKCVVDLNPANSEFLTIQNQMGTKEQGILIGDYKVNQPKDGRVQKQGVMQTPLLETDNDKQAF